MNSGMNDANVHYFEFDEQDPNDGYGTLWHPNGVTHAKMAARLVGVMNATVGRQ
jgi:hypothetical protein